jgi:hypothetical protein
LIVVDFDAAVVVVKLLDESDIPLKDTFNVLSLSCDDEREEVSDESEEVDESESSEDDDGERLEEKKILSLYMNEHKLKPL